MHWIPRQWWAGQDAFIIGGGSSLRGFDWNRLRGRLTVGCNDAYELGSSVCSVVVFGDMKWWNAHKSQLKEFPNPIFTNQPSLHASGPDWILTMRREPQGSHRDALGWGGNTGCLAVNVALLLGALRVFLLGVDCHAPSKDETNWHENNGGKPTAASYERFKKGFGKIATDLPKVFPGRSIINLGPDSRLESFSRMDLDEVLK